MPITTASLAVNFTVGWFVWTSQLPLIAKSILTAVLIGKYILFCRSVWVDAEDRTRKCEIAICIILNTLVAGYALYNHELLVAISAGALLTVLLIWAFARVYNFTFRVKQE